MSATASTPKRRANTGPGSTIGNAQQQEQQQQQQQQQPLDEHEIRIRQELMRLISDIRRIGPTYPTPQPRCLFSELFDDESVQNYYEALVGTLKCAKKRGLVRFDGQVLLRGMHDDVVISIAGEAPPPPMRLGSDGMLEVTNEKEQSGADKSPTKGRRWSKDRAMAASGGSGPLSPGARKKAGGVSPVIAKYVLAGDNSKAALPAAGSPVGLGTASAGTMVDDGGVPSVPSLGVNADGSSASASASAPTASDTAAPTATTVPAGPKTAAPSSSSKRGSRPTFNRLHSLPAIRTSASHDNAILSGGSQPSSSSVTASKLISPTAQTATAGIVFRSYSRQSSSADKAKSVNDRVEAEIARLPGDITRIGSGEYANSPRCTFGELFDDDDVQNHYEALVGTLKSAKKRGVVNFEGQMLLKGMHDSVVIEVVEKEDDEGGKEVVGVEAISVEDTDRKMNGLEVNTTATNSSGRDEMEEQEEQQGAGKAAGEVTREA